MRHDRRIHPLLDTRRPGSRIRGPYGEAQHALLESAQCLGYELSRCHEEPNRYILRIEWQSLDAHLQGFRGSAQFRAFLGHIKPFIPNIDEMQHYRVTAVTSAEATPSSG